MINSVGGGGAYVNVIVEEHVESMEETFMPLDAPTPQLFVFSAKNAERLQVIAHNMLSFLEEQEDVSLIDMAYTLQIGREEMKSRLAIVADAHADLVRKLTRYLDTGGKEVFADSSVVAGEASVQSRRESGPFFGHQVAGGPRQTSTGYGDLEALAAHWVTGGKVEWNQLPRAKAVRRIVLPTYPFARSKASPAFDESALLLGSEE
jgi:acyl transferase domain-containing protein